MLTIGVIGAGHLGKIHIKILKELSQEGIYDLKGFYDADQNNAEKVSGDFNIPAFSSIDELIAQCDVVDVVTPTLSHYDCASKALKKSRHVFIEKPLTNTVEEAKKLMLLAEEADVKVQVGHVERFNPAFTAAKQYITAPMFIETHRLAQFNPRGTDVSVVLDLMIHDLDIILSLVKANIRKISASGVAVVSSTPDIANARIEFDNGCVVNLTASRISLKNMRKSRFFQRDAYISVDFLDKEVQIVRLSEINGEPDPLSVVIDLGENKPKKEIYFETPEVTPNNAIKDELKSFAQSIQHNTTPEVTIHDGFQALSVAHQIVEKLKTTVSLIED